MRELGKGRQVRTSPSDPSGAGALKPSSQGRRTSRCFNQAGGVWCYSS